MKTEFVQSAIENAGWVRDKQILIPGRSVLDWVYTNPKMPDYVVVLSAANLHVYRKFKKAVKRFLSLRMIDLVSENGWFRAGPISFLYDPNFSAPLEPTVAPMACD